MLGRLQDGVSSIASRHAVATGIYQWRFLSSALCFAREPVFPSSSRDQGSSWTHGLQAKPRNSTGWVEDDVSGQLLRDDDCWIPHGQCLFGSSEMQICGVVFPFLYHPMKHPILLSFDICTSGQDDFHHTGCVIVILIACIYSQVSVKWHPLHSCFSPLM